MTREEHALAAQYIGEEAKKIEYLAIINTDGSMLELFLFLCMVAAHHAIASKTCPECGLWYKGDKCPMSEHDYPYHP